MKRFLIIVTLTGLVGALAAPVAAGNEDIKVDQHARGARVVITADVSLSEQFEGPFQARGAAVQRGIVCPSGELAGTVTGFDGPLYDFTVRHVFTCDDGSGTFSIDLWVRLFDSGRTLFRWSVAEGTGPYVDLSGAGVGFGIPGTAGENIVDRYLGRLHG